MGRNKRPGPDARWAQPLSFLPLSSLPHLPFILSRAVRQRPHRLGVFAVFSRVSDAFFFFLFMIREPARGCAARMPVRVCDLREKLRINIDELQMLTRLHSLSVSLCLALPGCLLSVG